MYFLSVKPNVITAFASSNSLGACPREKQRMSETDARKSENKEHNIHDILLFASRKAQNESNNGGCGVGSKRGFRSARGIILAKGFLLVDITMTAFSGQPNFRALINHVF